ncbi:uncharacterized protein Ret [Diabrotica undecimpunctata]|uniref:uncharacterized protein Ret n=1 Tax=Diabrotica undecimpunctata TaxID=50387 RepID=UPI003B641CCC
MKDIFVVWIFAIQAYCGVLSAYFSMSDIKLTIPRAIKNYIRSPYDESIVDLRAMSDGPRGREDLIYGLNGTGEYIQINATTGGVFLTPTFIKQIDKIGTISLTATVKDTLNSDSDNTTFQVSVSPLKELDCDEIVEDICFWSQVSYKVERTNVGVPLGQLSSPRLLKICPFKISYQLKPETFVTLVPPNTIQNYWSLALTQRARKFKEADIHLKLTCTVETVSGKQKGNVREVKKDITLSLLDIDRYPPKPQLSELNIELSKRNYKKGDKIEHPHLIFIDNDTANANHYDFYIEDGNEKPILKPICKEREYPWENKTRTAIHCKFEVKQEILFKTSIYSFTLILNDTSLNNKSIESAAEFPIHLVFRDTPESLTKLKLYPSITKIFRTAAPYARVVQPKDLNGNYSDFVLDEMSKFKEIFNITKSEGIVFVHDFLKLKNITTQFLSLNISWTNNNKRESDQIEVRLIHEPNQTCGNINKIKRWSSCSEYETIDECLQQDSCALGTGGFQSVNNRNGPKRCMWRGDEITVNITHLYSTCTPETKTCPDGICDSLEESHYMLCPQDCAEQAAFPLKLNKKTGRGIDEASGTIICNSGKCQSIKSRRSVPKATSNKEKPPKQQLKEALSVSRESMMQNVTLGGLVSSKCGFSCLAGIGAGALFLVTSTILMIVCWKIRKTRKSARNLSEKDSQELTAPLSVPANRSGLGEPLSFNFPMASAINDTSFVNSILSKYAPDPKWEFPRSQLVIEQTLGEGEFGKVLRAKANNICGKQGYTTVAVKTLKDDARESELNDLLSEYQLLKEVSHPNVIRLLGVSTTPGGPVYLIIEYAEFGSLRNYLRRTRHLQNNSTEPQILLKDDPVGHYDEPKVSDITPKDLLSFAWQICNGMGYLSDMKLVHRDLAARNVLLADDKVCKISDFGLTRDVYEDNAYLKRSKGRVPVKWMAPESLADHIYTTKSDVWSFGILIWELVTLGATPYPGIAVQNLFHLLRQGYRMERPDNCSPGLYKIMRNCWSIDPEQRPSFQDLSKWFAKLLEDKMEYINLSNNAIYNRGYFISPFEEEGDEEEDDEESNLDDTSSEINPLNYLSRTESLEKCKIRETELNEELEKIADDKITNTEGYETPIKVPRKLKTPSNEDPQEYTDMGGK